ncbi:MAG: hypothetical protein V7607_2633 [Solirubrobacteraceae bacterium]
MSLFGWAWEGDGAASAVDGCTAGSQCRGRELTLERWIVDRLEQRLLDKQDPRSPAPCLADAGSIQLRSRARRLVDAGPIQLLAKG